MLAEGRDTEIVVRQLVTDLGLDMQVMDFGGVTDLGDFIKVLALTPGFADLTCLAVVRDADENAASARQAVQHHLAPFRSDARRAIEFILPNDIGPGMLETLCLASVAGDKAMHCVDAFSACLKLQGGTLNEKGLVHAFLSTRDKPGLKIGEAFRARFWPKNRAPLEPLEVFLRSI